MRETVAISLILCLVFQTFSKSTLIAIYALDKQLIVDFFCVNKDKVEMHCEGSCFMDKQLEEDNGQEAPASETVREQEVHLFLTSSLDCFSIIPGTKRAVAIIYTAGRDRLSHFSIFHPPQNYQYRMI